MIHFEIKKDQCSAFELEMIGNAYIENLIEVNSSVECTESHLITLYFSPKHELITLDALISKQQLSLNHIRLLTRQLVYLDQCLSKHLLQISKIAHDATQIFYSYQSNQFFFVYVPTTDPLAKNNLLSMYQHIFLETKSRLHAKVLPILNSNQFSLSVIHSILIRSKHFSDWPSLFKNKSSTLKTLTKPLGTALIDKENPQIVHRLYFERTTIGREASNNVVLSDPNVSRNHAYITITSKECAIYDCSSRNGTFVNGLALQSGHTLKSGDCVHLGGKEFIFVR